MVALGPIELLVGAACLLVVVTVIAVVAVVASQSRKGPRE
jgi:hypothetical protein